MSRLHPAFEGEPPILDRDGREEHVSDRLAIVAALEALGSGETAYATEILLGTLEDGPTERRYACECGMDFEWPGLLDHHRRFSHELEVAA
jgi:hypothetical protein